MAAFKPNQKLMSWVWCPGFENQDTLDDSLWWRYLLFEWKNLSVGLNCPVPTLCNIFNMLAFHPLHHRTPRFNSILCIFYNFFGLRMFPAPQDLMPQFIFIYTPQILDHFHFISNPISILFFVSSSFTWLLSLRWIFTIFPAREARLGLCIFVYLQSG